MEDGGGRKGRGKSFESGGDSIEINAPVCYLHFYHDFLFIAVYFFNVSSSFPFCLLR